MRWARSQPRKKASRISIKKPRRKRRGVKVWSGGRLLAAADQLEHAKKNHEHHNADDEQFDGSPNGPSVGDGGLDFRGNSRVRLGAERQEQGGDESRGATEEVDELLHVDFAVRAFLCLRALRSLSDHTRGSKLHTTGAPRKASPNFPGAEPGDRDTDKERGSRSRAWRSRPWSAGLRVECEWGSNTKCHTAAPNQRAPAGRHSHRGVHSTFHSQAFSRWLTF